MLEFASGSTFCSNMEHNSSKQSYSSAGESDVYNRKEERDDETIEKKRKTRTEKNPMGGKKRER